MDSIEYTKFLLIVMSELTLVQILSVNFWNQHIQLDNRVTMTTNEIFVLLKCNGVGLKFNF